MVLARATTTLDHFPSLAELKVICDYLQGDKPPGTAHGRTKTFTIDPIEPGHERISPWPEPIEATMLMIARGDTESGGFTFGLRYNKLTEDEAFYLFECFAEKRFEDEKALTILHRYKPRKEVVATVVNKVMEKVIERSEPIQEALI